MSTFRRCARCLSVGLVCACLTQGAKAPPANAVNVIIPLSTATGTAAMTTHVIVDMNTGRTPAASPRDRQIIFEVYGPPKRPGIG